MYDVLLALHLLFAVFAIGPLVHAATTASRGLRKADGAAIAVTLGVLAPALSRATSAVTRGGVAGALTVRVAAAGGIVGLIFAAIVFLMVHRPGH